MKRVIVDYAKLTNEILTLLVERFPEGYDDSHIIRFKNARNENIEAVEVRTEDTIYLVKVSTKLADRIENFDEDDIDDTVEDLDALKDLEIADDADDDDDDADTDKDIAGTDTDDADPDDMDDDDIDTPIAEDDDEDEDEY
jgi:DNA-directed RNA polymerase subunit delta